MIWLRLFLITCALTTAGAGALVWSWPQAGAVVAAGMFVIAAGFGAAVFGSRDSPGGTR